MRYSRLILALGLCAAPYLAQAQFSRSSGCDEKGEQCVSECRARMFTIDPRRSICLHNCSQELTACTQSKEDFCIVGHHC
jgi:hypothetical protein